MAGTQDITWSPLLRRLHFALALAVTLQLVLSLFMDPKGEGLKRGLFLIHELDGLLVFACVVFHWLWLACGNDGGLPRLFPWLFSQGRQAILEDLRGLLERKLPTGGPSMGLPALVEGIGLLLVTLQGTTGLIFWTSASVTGALPEALEPMVELHKLGGKLLWVFGIGHGGMALVHALLGDPAVRAISPFTWRSSAH